MLGLKRVSGVHSDQLRHLIIMVNLLRQPRLVDSSCLMLEWFQYASRNPAAGL